MTDKSDKGFELRWQEWNADPDCGAYYVSKPHKTIGDLRAIASVFYRAGAGATLATEMRRLVGEPPDPAPSLVDLAIGCAVLPELIAAVTVTWPDEKENPAIVVVLRAPLAPIEIMAPNEAGAREGAERITAQWRAALEAS